MKATHITFNHELNNLAWDDNVSVADIFLLAAISSDMLKDHDIEWLDNNHDKIWEKFSKAQLRLTGKNE